MTNPTNQQSLKRQSDSLSQLFSSSAEKNPLYKMLLITSSSDIGVIRNGGRNGSKYGPRSLLATLKRMNTTSAWNNRFLKTVEVACEQSEKQNFVKAQQLETEKIRALLNPSYNLGVVHIGGGHDHIFPLLMAHSKDYKRIIVINVDAHADTRPDEDKHSGTPFRQFSKSYSGDFHLFQFGLHDFANSSSTLSPFEKGQMYLLWKNDLNNQLKMNETFQQIQGLIETDTLVVFSLDADAMGGHLVPGVSAVNGCGLNAEQLKDLWNRYKGLNFPHPKILGIYELNPVYDSTSSLSMRFMADFLFESMT